MDLTYNKIVFTLVTGFVLAVITPLIQVIIKSKFMKNREMNNLKASLDDGIRHCYENLKVLIAIYQKIDLVPSMMHIKKLAIPVDLAFFVDNKTQNISGENISLVHNVKVKARNINIEIETLIEDLKNSTFQKKTESKRKEYIEYLIHKNEYITRIFKEVKDLLDIEMIDKSKGLSEIKVGERDGIKLSVEDIEKRLIEEFNSEWIKPQLIHDDQDESE